MSFKKLNISKKIAVVTCAHKGLGLAIVEKLSQKFNGIVYLTSRNEEKGQRAVDYLNDLGLRPRFHKLDINDPDSIERFADFIKSEHGAFDVLVNNPPILDEDELVPTYTEAKLNIDVNYKSLVNIERYLFHLLRDNGSVVNITGACSIIPDITDNDWKKLLMHPDLMTDQINEFVEEYLESIRTGTFDETFFANNHGEHKIAKIAVTALTRVQQRNYEHLRINAINPGFVKNDMTEDLGKVKYQEAAGIVAHVILEEPFVKGQFVA